MPRFWAMASTLSGTRKKESSSPYSVPERSCCLRKSSKASRLTRQCLPTFRHGRRRSRHQRQTVVSLTPISSATSSAPSNPIISVDRATVPPFTAPSDAPRRSYPYAQSTDLSQRDLIVSYLTLSYLGLSYRT